MGKVVLDVNILVLASIAPLGRPRQILDAWQANRFSVVTSAGIIFRSRRKLRLPRIGGKYQITQNDIDQIRNLLLTQAEVVSVSTQDIVPLPMTLRTIVHSPLLL
jgi:predicted nucleic acid-binding protein